MPVTKVHEAKKGWTTTYWPMASSSGNQVGSASANLWAENGALDKFDRLLKARGMEIGARAHEVRPYLNSLVGKERGYFIGDSMLDEKDAERTTGVDLNGNGKIDDLVEWDFLDSRGAFGKDGKTDGKMSVSWWGSCDLVARAGLLFDEPKKDVTVDGITFTPQDIKGLLTILASGEGDGTEMIGNRYDDRADVIVLRSGEQLRGTILTDVDWNGPGIRHVAFDNSDADFAVAGKLPDEIKVKMLDGSEATFKAVELKEIAREDRRDDAALFHTTVEEWLDKGRGGVMDKDSTAHVWNYNFYKAVDTVYENGEKPNWAPDELKGFNGPAGDGDIKYYDRTIHLGGDAGSPTYNYWIEWKNGAPVNSGFVGTATPDFLWRPRGQATFAAPGARNPFVSPKLVKKIYEQSIEP
jgi:hypothetical protein